MCNFTGRNIFYKNHNIVISLRQVVLFRSGLSFLMRISCLYSCSGAAWFHGNWYLRPEEAKHMPTKMFFEQECFQSNIEDTNPMASIMGLCFIMHMKDYVACKPIPICLSS